MACIERPVVIAGTPLAGILGIDKDTWYQDMNALRDALTAIIPNVNNEESNQVELIDGSGPSVKIRSTIYQ